MGVHGTRHRLRAQRRDGRRVQRQRALHLRQLDRRDWRQRHVVCAGGKLRCRRRLARLVLLGPRLGPPGTFERMPRRHAAITTGSQAQITTWQNNRGFCHLFTNPAAQRAFGCGVLALPNAALPMLPARAFADFVTFMEAQRREKAALEGAAPRGVALEVTSLETLRKCISEQVEGSSARVQAAFAKRDQARQGKLAPSDFAASVRDLGVGCTTGIMHGISRMPRMPAAWPHGAMAAMGGQKKNRNSHRAGLSPHNPPSG
mgnify:CR=1 FL=1